MVFVEFDEYTLFINFMKVYLNKNEHLQSDDTKVFKNVRIKKNYVDISLKITHLCKLSHLQIAEASYPPV